MKTVCAWCKKVMKEGSPSERDIISHGICENCSKVVTNFNFTDLKTFLDTIKAPILLANENVTILSANEKAMQALGKSQNKLEHLLGGEVMDCKYSELPGGCGHTNKCTACTLRSAVEYTHKTGKPKTRVEAFQFKKQPDGYVRTKYTFSTQKIGENVLIRVDGSEPSPE